MGDEDREATLTHRIVTLTTDFGTRDPYVGMMKGVILSIAPEAEIVDITHEVPAQDVRTGAFILERTLRYFPPSTIHVAVVDPGVGTKRRALVIETDDGILVGPDNGLLSLGMKRSKRSRSYAVTDTAYFLPEVSRTFHGRDVFAPMAAHLVRGVTPSGMGKRFADIVTLDWPQPRKKGKKTVATIVHVDRFGNLITNLEAPVAGIKQTYQDVARGKVVVYMGSYGLVEVAVRDGSAAKTLELGVGDELDL